MCPLNREQKIGTVLHFINSSNLYDYHLKLIRTGDQQKDLPPNYYLNLRWADIEDVLNSYITSIII